MDRNQDVKDIIIQLESLQIQQTTLIARLGRLSESAENNREATPALFTTREFVIGDKVRIKNPRVLQSNKGTIVRVGDNRITVLAKNGTRIIRAPKNLILDNE